MKKTILTVLAATIITVGGTVLFSSCEKDGEQSKAQQIGAEMKDPKAIDLTKLPFFVNGVVNGNVNQLDTNNMVSILCNDTLFYFDNNALLHEFCTAHDCTKFYEANAKLDSIYQMAVQLGIENKDFEDVSDVPEEMQAYWYAIFGSKMSTDVLGSEAKFPWFVKAYDNANFGGSSKACVGPTYWSLGSFNSKTSSFKIYNTGIGGFWWCHKKWYSKPRMGVLALGLPIGEVPFKELPSAHNNKFCSYFSVL